MITRFPDQMEEYWFPIATVIIVVATIVFVVLSACDRPRPTYVGGYPMTIVTIEGHQYIATERFMLHNENCPCKPQPVTKENDG